MNKGDFNSAENLKKELENAQSIRKERDQELTNASYRFELEVQKLPEKMLREKLEKLNKKSQETPKHRRNSF